MDFLKKNLAKLVIALIALSAIVLMLVPVFKAANVEFYGACQTVGIILFFVGLALFACFKMSDSGKALGKYIVLATGILVLTFMSIGLTGFSKEKDNAQGALGNSYAIFKELEETAKNGTTSLNTLKGHLDAVPASGNTPLSNVAASGASALDLVEALTGSGLGITATSTIDQAKAVLSAALVKAEEGRSDANAGALTVLFAYISMMLAFGLIPTVYGVKKLVCSKDE